RSPTSSGNCELPRRSSRPSPNFASAGFNAKRPPGPLSPSPAVSSADSSASSSATDSGGQEKSFDRRQKSCIRVPAVPHGRYKEEVGMNAVMAASLLSTFGQADTQGKVIVILLCLGSALTWTIMLTKWQELRRCQKTAGAFLAQFRRDRDPLHLFINNYQMPDSPRYNI